MRQTDGSTDETRKGKQSRNRKESHMVNEQEQSHTPPSNTPRMSDTSVRSAKNGDISVSSVSWGSLNQEETGTALLG